jgi:hypothetical protein
MNNQIKAVRQAFKQEVRGIDLKNYVRENLAIKIPADEIDMTLGRAEGQIESMLKLIIKACSGEAEVYKNTFLEEILLNELWSAMMRSSQLHYVGLIVYMYFIHNRVPDILVKHIEKELRERSEEN